VFYFHPYEFTRRSLYLDGGMGPNRRIGKMLLLHNFNTRRIERTLRRIARDLKLAPLRELSATVPKDSK
jgi:hypothetical protein